MRPRYPLILLALLAAACTGPRTELPGYGQAPAAAAAPSPSPAFRGGAGAGSLEVIAARLSRAILQPDMCNRLNCPRSGGYVVELIEDEAVNAATDGDRIYVARGLLDFAANDGEVAAVLAHEIAHGLLDHLGSKQQDAIVVTALLSEPGEVRQAAGLQEFLGQGRLQAIEAQDHDLLYPGLGVWTGAPQASPDHPDRPRQHEEKRRQCGGKDGEE